MLEVVGLLKEYGRFRAVNGLNLSVQKGSIFGFVGPNGAGKTTTMKIIAGLLRATSGDIRIDGQSVLKSPRLLRERMGYMPDFFGVYDNLKVKEYMDFYCGAYYIPYAERGELIDNLLEIVNLTAKKDTYVDSLSRGMKQRLCLARSLVHDPDILILDEPASGLDPRARVEIKEVLKQLRQMEKTIIISSHILPELSELCTEIGIIERGQMKVQGTVSEILRMLTKKRMIYVKALDNRPLLLQVLQEQPEVTEILENTEDLEFAFAGEDEKLAGILTAVISAGVRLTAFKEKEGNLEDIFMQVTGGNLL